VTVTLHLHSSSDSGGPRGLSRLAETRLFAAGFLSREEQYLLEGAALPAKAVEAATDLVPEGGGADCLFILVEGWACRYSTTREGGRQIAALLLPGDIGNLDSLMFDRLDCGVRTLTEATIVALPRDRASVLAEQHPGIARSLTWAALVEAAIASKWALSLGRKSAPERLAHLICELSVRLDAEDGNSSRFPLPLTQEQIADALGLTAVHVNRTMQRLRAEGLIGTENRSMIILDLMRLQKFGGFDPRYLRIASPGDAELTCPEAK
jgi:CRP-like cAMP-binding protein